MAKGTFSHVKTKTSHSTHLIFYKTPKELIDRKSNPDLPLRNLAPSQRSSLATTSQVIRITVYKFIWPYIKNPNGFQGLKRYFEIDVQSNPTLICCTVPVTSFGSISTCNEFTNFWESVIHWFINCTSLSKLVVFTSRNDLEKIEKITDNQIMFRKNTYWQALSLKSQLRIKTEQILLETLELVNDYIEVSQLLNYFSNLS